MVKMYSRIRVLSCRLWIICMMIMVITCETNFPSRKSARASHRTVPDWGADDAMQLFADMQFPIRHRKFRKLDQVIKERLNFSPASKNPLDFSVGGEGGDRVDGRNEATTINTTTSNDRVRDSIQKSNFPGLKDHSEEAGQTSRELNQNENTFGKVLSISNAKTEGVGSREKNKKKPSVENELKQKVLDYYDKMKKDTLCQIPSPIVVHVKDELPGTDADLLVKYLPPCIKLHRCSDRTGCCYGQTLQCSAIKTENVQLPFKISVKGKNGTDVRYEFLTFKNHTECGCTSIKNVLNEKMQQDANSPSTTSSWIYDGSVESSNNISWNDECHCPHPFAKRVLPDNTCICDCFDKDKACLRRKQGLERLASHQKECISSGKCSLPTCEYGMYLPTRGTCPKYYGVAIKIK